MWAVLRTLRDPAAVHCGDRPHFGRRLRVCSTRRSRGRKLGAAGFLLTAWSLMITPTSGGAVVGDCRRTHGTRYLCAMRRRILDTRLRCVVCQQEVSPTCVVPLAASAVVVLLVVPWAAYQRYVDPPGNRLMKKWHLAGVAPIDDRGIVEDTRRQLLGRGSVAPLEQVVNFVQAFDPTYRGCHHPRTRSSAHARKSSLLPCRGSVRDHCFSFCCRRRSYATRPTAPVGALVLVTMAWCGASLVAWCLLVFEPEWILVHTASYAMLLPLIALPAAAVRTWSRGLYVVARDDPVRLVPQLDTSCARRRRHVPTRSNARDDQHLRSARRHGCPHDRRLGFVHVQVIPVMVVPGPTHRHVVEGTTCDRSLTRSGRASSHHARAPVDGPNRTRATPRRRTISTYYSPVCDRSGCAAGPRDTCARALRSSSREAASEHPDPTG